MILGEPMALRMVEIAEHGGAGDEREERLANGRVRPVAMGDQGEISGQLQARSWA